MTEQELEEKVMQHDVDLYRGRGKSDPPITGRLLLLENAIERFGKNSSKLVWLVIGTLIVGLANLVFHK